MNQQFKNVLKFILFLGIGLTILGVVFRQQTLAFQAQCALDGISSEKCSLSDKLINDFKSIHPFWICLVLVSFIFSNFSRAVRWLHLIEPLGYKVKLSNSFWTVNLGYFANLGLPRMGELIRAGTMGRYEKIPVEKLMGTVVVDRILDMFSLLIVVGLAFLLEFDTLWSFLSPYLQKKEGNSSIGILQNPIVLGFLVTCVLGIIGLFVFWKKIKATALFQKIQTILKGFLEGLQSVKNVKNVWSLLFHSINIWFMYYIMAYFCFKAFPPTAHLSPLVALMVFVFGAFGVVVPSPGGMGTYHLLVMAALSLYNIRSSDAFSFANIFFFSVNIFCNIILGVIALIILPILNKNYKKT